MSVTQLQDESFSLFEQLGTSMVLAEASKKLESSRSMRPKQHYRMMHHDVSGILEPVKPDKPSNALQMRIDLLETQLSVKESECLRYKAEV